MTTDQFKALTGEEARLPEGMQKVKVLWGWVYMLKAQFNEEMTANIDAGIYRHASIGFKAADITPIKGQYDNILYYEYVPPGEALEGSIVWLGAQPGATAQKGAIRDVSSQNRECDYSKDNPLTPEKKDRRNTADGEERNFSDNPLSPRYRGKKTIQRCILAP
jgi:hypothetical protein